MKEKVEEEEEVSPKIWMKVKVEEEEVSPKIWMKVKVDEEEVSPKIWMKVDEEEVSPNNYAEQLSFLNSTVANNQGNEEKY